jgi:hypothetical protein
MKSLIWGLCQENFWESEFSSDYSSLGMQIGSVCQNECHHAAKNTPSCRETLTSAK